MVPSKLKPPKSKRLLLIEKLNLRPITARYYNGKGWEDRSGYFHCWSHGNNEDGSAYQVGVIEWLDGKCSEISINNFRFTDRD